jgi:uncharacterized membrane protein YidH (DUF202 family)
MKIEIIEKLSTLVTAALGLVAALAWNGTIEAIFKKFFGETDGVWSMLIYALIVTIIAVVVTIWIGKVSERAKKL